MPLRVYLVIHANTVAIPTENQWQALMNATKGKPMASAIVLAARSACNHITVSKRNLGTNTMRYTLGIFEIEDNQQAALLTLLDTQALAHNVTGSVRTKLAGVLQAELRAAATDLGYGAQANNLTLTLVNAAIANTFDVDVAVTQVQAYLAANAAIWYAA